MVYDYYITPDEYDIAAKHGIDANRVDVRVRNYGWDKKRAITEPVRQYKDMSEYLEIARDNNIKASTFYERVNRGMDIDEACTKPPSPPCLDKMREKSIEKMRKYPDWVYENIKKNNIKIGTFWRRVNHLGWTLEDASTIKTLKRGQKTKGTKNHIWRKHDEARYQEYVSRHKNKV